MFPLLQMSNLCRVTDRGRSPFCQSVLVGAEGLFNDKLISPIELSNHHVNIEMSCRFS